MELDVLIPVRNQNEKLLRNLKSQVIPYFDEEKISYEIHIGASGSSQENYDELEGVLKSFPSNVHLLPFDPAKGKGYGVRQLILNSNADYILFMDADLSTDLKAFDEIKPLLGKYKAFFGSRHSKDSKILSKQTLVRRITSLGSRVIIRNKFHLAPLRDTQCGYKCIEGNLAKQIAERQIIMGFAFDVEYAYILKLNHIEVKEIPVSWKNDPDSTVSAFKTSVNFYKDLKRIKRNKANYLFDK